MNFLLGKTVLWDSCSISLSLWLSLSLFLSISNSLSIYLFIGFSLLFILYLPLFVLHFLPLPSLYFFLFSSSPFVSLLLILAFPLSLHLSLSLSCLSFFFHSFSLFVALYLSLFVFALPKLHLNLGQRWIEGVDSTWKLILVLAAKPSACTYSPFNTVHYRWQSGTGVMQQWTEYWINFKFNIKWTRRRKWNTDAMNVICRWEIQDRRFYRCNLLKSVVFVTTEIIEPGWLECKYVFCLPHLRCLRSFV